MVAHYNGTDWVDLGGVDGVTGSVLGGGSVSMAAVNNFSPTQFTFGTLTGVNPVPVKLISAGAKLNGIDAVINWATASEINNDRFEIERSLNGVDFIKIGTVLGSGNSNQIITYSYIDKAISNLPVPILYYRLKQIDYNGVSEYSHTFALSLTKGCIETKAVVSPVPFYNELNISLSDCNFDMAHIQIISLTGALMMDLTQLPDEGRNICINTQTIPNGIYIMTIHQNGIVTNYRILKM